MATKTPLVMGTDGRPSLLQAGDTLAGGGGMAIGAAVTGAGVNRVLFTDPSGNLSHSPQFTFDSDTFTFVAKSGFIQQFIGFIKFYGNYSALTTVEVDNYGYNAPGASALALIGGLGQSSPLFLLQQMSSTTTKRSVAVIDGVWITSTDATRTGRLLLKACDYTGTDREGLRVDSDGTQALLGFFGGTAVAKPTGDVVAALGNLGLVANPAFGHLVTAGTTPALAAGTGAGTTPTVAVAGNDTAGVLSITTGTAPAAAATVVTVTFAVAYGAAPRAVLLTPANAAAAALAVAACPYVDSAALTAAVFVLKSAATALAASTAYKWYYHVIG